MSDNYEPPERDLPACRSCEDRGWLPDDSECSCLIGRQWITEAEFEAYCQRIEEVEGSA